MEASDVTPSGAATGGKQNIGWTQTGPDSLVLSRSNPSDLSHKPTFLFEEKNLKDADSE